jgi:hypothetical protein
MRRITAGLALAFCLIGCASSGGGSVPLKTDESVTRYGDMCILMHEVVDVTADPLSGEPVLNGGGGAYDVSWPHGFTARRAGSEVEVLDASGSVVLTTGARYWICPSEYLNGWVVGMVKPCPDCELGFRVD